LSTSKMPPVKMWYFFFYVSPTGFACGKG
jgi:hypothetical protein